MSRIKRAIALAILLVALALGGWFYLENRAPVALTVFGLALPEAALALVVLGAFALGVALGLASAQFGAYRMRRQNRSLTRRLQHSDSGPRADRAR